MLGINQAPAMRVAPVLGINSILFDNQFRRESVRKGSVDQQIADDFAEKVVP